MQWHPSTGAMKSPLVFALDVTWIWQVIERIPIALFHTSHWSR
jgi:hypothetical protein